MHAKPCTAARPCSYVNPTPTTLQIQEQYDGLRTEHDALRRGVAALQGLQEWKAEAGAYSQVLAWAAVEEQAATVAGLEEKVGTTLPERTATVEADVAALQAQHDAALARSREKEAALQSFGSKSDALTGEVEGLQAAKSAAHRAVLAARRRVDALKRRRDEEAARMQVRFWWWSGDLVADSWGQLPALLQYTAGGIKVQLVLRQS